MRYQREKTIYEITIARRQCIEARQTYKRLLVLLPKRFATIKKTYASSNKAGKAMRLALNSELYLQYLKEIIKLKNLALESQIKWETLTMKMQVKNYDPR